MSLALANRYTIEREIGAGGMATVYLARDLRHDRPVAVKVLHPALAAVLGSERFLAEIRTTANLQHPHILPLHDSGDANGFLYYVMPFVPGETLRARLEREQQLPLDDALRITMETLGALDYAHRHGVIHRDVKPENILLHDGAALVADFGIALAVTAAGGQRLTQTGLSLGTPQYMSPEQAMADRNIDGRSDVYAAGCVLYEMLVGEPPFTGPSAQAIVTRVLTEPVRSLRAQRDTISSSLEAAVLKALAKLPADRHATPAAFADALRVSGTAPADRAATATATTPSARRSLRVWQIVAACATAIALFATWRSATGSAGDNELQLVRQLTFEGTVTGTAISPDGLWLAYVTDDCHDREFTCTHTLQVREVDGTQSVRIARWPRIDEGLQWSADGATLMFSGSPDSSRRQVYFTGKLGGSLRRIPVRVTAMSFTPDGRYAVFATGRSGAQFLARYDASSLAPVDSARLPIGWTIFDLAFDSDGKRIAAIAGVQDGNSRIALFTPAAQLVDSMIAPGVRSWIRWAPSRSAVDFFVPTIGIGDNLQEVAVDGGRFSRTDVTLRLGQVPVGYQGAFDFSASGRMALVAAPMTHRNETLQLDSLALGWHAFVQRTSFTSQAEISPDGHLVVETATDNLGDNIYTFALANGEQHAVTADRGEHEQPQWSPDGHRLLYRYFGKAGTELVMVDATGGRSRTIVPHEVRAYSWIANDSVVIYRAGALVTLDTSGAERSRFSIPDSLEIASRPIGNARNGQLAYWSERAGAVVLADPRHQRFEQLTRSATRIDPLSWGVDGTLFAEAYGDSLSTRNGVHRNGIVRVPASRGPPIRIADLPAGCAHVAISFDGRRLVCNLFITAPDVWLAERPIQGRKRQ